jgi:hypothetical protein
MTKPPDYQQTIEFFQLNFLSNKVPTWYHRRKDFITDIAELHTIQQGVFYQHFPESLYWKTRYNIYRKYKASYRHIDICLGVCACDLSQPYGILRDFLLQAEPKLTRTTR